MSDGPLSRRALLGSVAATFVDLRLVRAETSASSTPRLLEARPGEIRLGDSQAAVPALTYDGSVPGPLLRVKKDDEVALRLLNKLDAPTTLHWHGLRGFNAMDGVGGLTQAPVAPSGSFDVSWKATDPGFLLYRPATLPSSPDQIAKGLAGVLIVDEPQALDVDGENLLLLQEWTSTAGAPNTFTLGGKAAPFTANVAPGARLRLRLANAAASRIMLVVFAGIRPKIIAIDGQACDPFEPVRLTIPIAPGARFDLLVDMPTGEKTEAKLLLRDRETGGAVPDRDIAVWTTAGAPAKARPPTAPMPLNRLLPAEIKLDRAKKVEVALEPPKAAGARWLMAGVARSYSDKPLFTVARGTPVSIGFTNKSPVAVPMCVHGHAVRLLHDLDDGWEPYWRNGVIVPAGRAKHVAFLADAPGKWALRSDDVLQEAAGLSTWFEVT